MCWFVLHRTLRTARAEEKRGETANHWILARVSRAVGGVYECAEKEWRWSPPLYYLSF